ncbi:MAG: hypothetical protein WCF94_02015 [bacterium]
MNKLYIIGGPGRCGKTTIMREFLDKKKVVAVSSDAVRAGFRYLNKKVLQTNYSVNEIDDELTWQMMVGIILYYNHKNISLVLEGVVFTPDRVKSLELSNLEVRAVFVGFVEDNHIDSIIEFAHENKDWVYDNITKVNNGDDSEIRKMFKQDQENSKQSLLKAKEYGYSFFSIDNKPFEDYKKQVVDYLLE